VLGTKSVLGLVDLERSAREYTKREESCIQPLPRRGRQQRERRRRWGYVPTILHDVRDRLLPGAPTPTTRESSEAGKKKVTCPGLVGRGRLLVQAGGVETFSMRGAGRRDWGPLFLSALGAERALEHEGVPLPRLVDKGFGALSRKRPTLDFKGRQSSAGPCTSSHRRPLRINESTKATATRSFSCTAGCVVRAWRLQVEGLRHTTRIAPDLPAVEKSRLGRSYAVERTRRIFTVDGTRRGSNWTLGGWSMGAESSSTICGGTVAARSAPSASWISHPHPDRTKRSSTACSNLATSGRVLGRFIKACSSGRPETMARCYARRRNAAPDRRQMYQAMRQTRLPRPSPIRASCVPCVSRQRLVPVRAWTNEEDLSPTRGPAFRFPSIAILEEPKLFNERFGRSSARGRVTVGSGPRIRQTDAQGCPWPSVNPMATPRLLLVVLVALLSLTRSESFGRPKRAATRRIAGTVEVTTGQDSYRTGDTIVSGSATPGTSPGRLSSLWVLTRDGGMQQSFGTASSSRACRPANRMGRLGTDQSGNVPVRDGDTSGTPSAGNRYPCPMTDGPALRK